MRILKERFALYFLLKTDVSFFFLNFSHTFILFKNFYYIYNIIFILQIILISSAYYLCQFIILITLCLNMFTIMFKCISQVRKKKLNQHLTSSFAFHHLYLHCAYIFSIPVYYLHLIKSLSLYIHMQKYFKRAFSRSKENI